VKEQLYRRGRGGAQVRPFAGSAVVRCRGYSQPLQRALTDFGADLSFARAAEKMREHYGIKVPAQAARQITQDHAARLQAAQEIRTSWPPQPGVAQLIGEMDGTLVPVVTTQTSADRRRTRRVEWQEARVCLARQPGSVTPRFGATLGSVEQAGDRLLDCALRAGGGQRTQVHCVGDGAR